MDTDNEIVPAITYADLLARTGEQLGVSQWLEITQRRINAFAEATGDDQWIHVDVARAEREIGSTIAHGALVYSLIPLLRKSAFEVRGQARIVNYGSDKVRFLAPVHVGKRIRLLTTIARGTAKPTGVLVAFEHVIELEGETRPALIAETLSLFVGHRDSALSYPSASFAGDGARHRE